MSEIIQSYDFPNGFTETHAIITQHKVFWSNRLLSIKNAVSIRKPQKRNSYWTKK